MLKPALEDDYWRTRRAGQAGTPIVAGEQQDGGQQQGLWGLRTRSGSSARIRERACMVAVFAVPFAVNPWGLQVFDLPKAVLLRALVAVMVATLLRDAPAYLPPFRSPPGVAWTAPRVWVCVFGAVSCLATATAVDSGVAVWGDFQRQDGLVTTLFYLLLFLFVATELRDWRSAERLAQALVLGSVPVVAYGLVQVAGLDPIAWNTIDKSPIISTLGRSNHVGSYLSMTVTIAVATLVTARSRLFRAIVAIDAAGSLYLLVSTGARSAWLGLSVAVLAVAILTLAMLAARSARSASTAIKRALSVAIATATFVVACAFVAPDRQFSSGRATIDDVLAPIRSGSLSARLVIWRESLQLVAERPLLGWGPDGFALAFHHVYPPELVFYQGREVVTDRAHNLILHQAVNTGLLGLGAYLVLLGSIARSFLRSLHQAPKRNRVLAVAMLAAWLGHLADSMFSFDVAGTAVVFWALSGAGVALSRDARTAEHDETSSNSVSPSPASRWSQASALSAASRALAVLIVAVGLFGGVTSLVADTLVGLSLEPALPPAVQLSCAKLGAAAWPFEPAYRIRLGSFYFDRARRESNTAPWLALAGGSFREASALRPRDPYTWLPLADLLSYRASHFGERDSREAAEIAYERAIALAPTTATLYVAAARSDLADTRNDLAIVRLERATALDQTNAEAWDLLAGAYRALERANDAARASDIARTLREVPRDDTE